MFNGSSRPVSSTPTGSWSSTHDTDVSDEEVLPESMVVRSHDGRPARPPLPPWVRSRRDAIGPEGVDAYRPRLSAWAEDSELPDLSETITLSLPPQPKPLQDCLRDAQTAGPDGLPALTPVTFQRVLGCMRDWAAYGRCLPHLEEPEPGSPGSGLNADTLKRIHQEMSARRLQAVEVGALLMDWATASDGGCQRLIEQLKGCSADDAVDAVAAMVEASMSAFDVDQTSPTQQRLCEVCRASTVNGEAVVRSLDALEGINERGREVIPQAPYMLRWRHVRERLPQLTQAMLSALGQPVRDLPTLSSGPPPIPPRESLL